ncbi:hypothetical protein GGR77_003269 [Xanthomonas translucens]
MASRSTSRPAAVRARLGTVAQTDESGDAKRFGGQMSEIGARAGRGQEGARHQRVEHVQRYHVCLDCRQGQARGQRHLEGLHPVAAALGAQRECSIRRQNARQPFLMAHYRHEHPLQRVLQGTVDLAVLFREILQAQSQCVEWPQCLDAGPEHRAGRKIDVGGRIDADAKTLAQFTAGLQIAQPGVRP